MSFVAISNKNKTGTLLLKSDLLSSKMQSTARWFPCCFCGLQQRRMPTQPAGRGAGKRKKCDGEPSSDVDN